MNLRMGLTILLVVLVSLSEGARADLSPQQVVEKTSEQMIAALKANKSALQRDPGKIYGLVSRILLPHFDFDLIARWALGKYWRQANPAQRQRFTAEFRTLLVRTYAKVLLEYSDETIDFLSSPSPVAGRDDATVRTRIQPRTGAPIAVNYRMHRRTDSWKVFDIKVDGVSLVTNYRGTFASQVRDKGIDGMIDALVELNAKGES